jgi:hypothetical protein
MGERTESVGIDSLVELTGAEEMNRIGLLLVATMPTTQTMNNNAAATSPSGTASVTP